MKTEQDILNKYLELVLARKQIVEAYVAKGDISLLVEVEKADKKFFTFVGEYMYSVYIGSVRAFDELHNIPERYRAFC